MNRKLLWLIIGLFTVGLLILTNPKTDEHKAAVKEKANESIQKLNANAKSTSTSGYTDLGRSLGQLLGGYLIDRLVDTGITRSNYLLFSTTNLQWEGKTKVIGFGILGNVFISEKVDEAIQNASRKLN